jgi:hypothetical protein
VLAKNGCVNEKVAIVQLRPAHTHKIRSLCGMRRNILIILMSVCGALFISLFKNYILSDFTLKALRDDIESLFFSLPVDVFEAM